MAAGRYPTEEGLRQERCWGRRSTEKRRSPKGRRAMGPYHRLRLRQAEQRGEARGPASERSGLGCDLRLAAPSAVWGPSGFGPGQRGCPASHLAPHTSRQARSRLRHATDEAAGWKDLVCVAADLPEHRPTGGEAPRERKAHLLILTPWLRHLAWTIP